MPFHVSNLLAESRTLDVGGATVVYNPQLLTVDAYDQVGSDGGWDGLANALAMVLVSWDLEDDQGPIPVTKDGVRRLPIAVMDMVMGEIMDDMRPSSAEGNASSEPSPTPALVSTPQDGTFPNGGDSSRQPSSTGVPLGSSPVSPSAG